MAGLEIKSFDSPEETRPFEGKGKADIVGLDDRTISRAVFEPGWRWSVNVKPIAQTDSCQTAHFGYCMSGEMVIHMDDGTEGKVGPGDAFMIPPGHDAEVVGDEACVMVDFGHVATYAKRS